MGIIYSSMDTLEGQANTIVLEGLEGNNPAHLKGLQIFMAPHIGALTASWWLIFFLTLTVVILRGIVVPLLKKYRTS